MTLFEQLKYFAETKEGSLSTAEYAKQLDMETSARTSAPPHSPHLTCLRLALLVSQVHAWVLVLAGKRMLEASLFLEPSTG